jgi:antitoxin component YwqK of YwqJK toxin-antitoxin module
MKEANKIADPQLTPYFNNFKTFARTDPFFQEEGKETWYFPDGKKWLEKNWKGGLLDGLSITWDKYGKVVKKEIYKNGKIQK